MLKFQPFKNTTLTASYGYYPHQRQPPQRRAAARPILLLARERQATWDPTTQLIHVNGTTLGRSRPRRSAGLFREFADGKRGDAHHDV